MENFSIKLIQEVLKQEEKYLNEEINSNNLRNEDVGVIGEHVPKPVEDWKHLQDTPEDMGSYLPVSTGEELDRILPPNDFLNSSPRNNRGTKANTQPKSQMNSLQRMRQGREGINPGSSDRVDNSVYTEDGRDNSVGYLTQTVEEYMRNGHVASETEELDIFEEVFRKGSRYGGAR